MKQKIQIGVLSENPGFGLLLNAIGVPWDQCSNFSCNWKEHFSAIVTDCVPLTFRDAFHRFRNEGGAVLDFRTNESLFPGKVFIKKIKSILSDHAHPVFGGLGVIDFFDKAAFFDKNYSPESMIRTITSGAGPVICCGYHPGRAILNETSFHREFVVSSEKSAFEQVSTSTKQKSLHIMLRLLVNLHNLKNLPLVHKWWYPGDSSSVFAFRVDSDFAGKEVTNELIRFLNSEKIPSSWFLHTGAHNGWLDRFHKITNAEIGVHGHEHKIFDDPEKNRMNISQSIRLLNKAGFYPEGYAAPYGIWNESVSTAIESSNLKYSSEFSYSYDSLPLQTAKGFMQVPIHPVCTASLEKAGLSESEMKNYYKSVLHQKLGLNDPLIFYHHPNDYHLEVWESLFDTVRQTPGVTSLTLKQWYNWWTSREKFRPVITYENDSLDIKVEPTTNKIKMAVHTGNNKYFLCDARKLNIRSEAARDFYGPSIPDLTRTKASFSMARGRYEQLKSEFFNKLWRNKH